MSNTLQGKVIVVFTWHSAKNIQLLEPLLDFLGNDCGHSVHVITTDANGKMQLLEAGYPAYTVNELILRYPDATNLVPEPRRPQETPIDLTLNWLYTPVDPALIPHPVRDQSIDYFQWKHQQLIRTYSQFLYDLGADIVMTWNGALLVTGALAEAAESLGRSTYFLERGLLPKSLVVDPAGVNSKSALAGPDWHSLAADTVEGSQKEALKNYCQRLLEGNISIVNSGRQQAVDEVRAHLSIPNGTPVVLLPLQIESDSNILENSPLYKSMADLIRDVRDVLADSDALLVVKPHPEDKARRDTIDALCAPDGVRCCWDLSLSSLMPVTDLVVVINSTVGLESLMQNKPVIALGHSIYNRKGFTVDVSGTDELSDCLHKTLTSPRLPYDNADFWAFLWTLMTRYSFFYEHQGELDGRQNLRQALAVGPDFEKPAESSQLKQLRQTNTQLQQVLSGARHGRYLIIGPFDTIQPHPPTNVHVLNRRSHPLMILWSLIHRYDAVICMEMPSSRLAQRIFSLFRSPQKCILG